MIQYIISNINIFCDKKFKSLFISLFNKENIVNGRQTKNRTRARVRACVANKFYFVYRRQPFSFFSFFTQKSIFMSAIHFQIYKRQNLAQQEQ